MRPTNQSGPDESSGAARSASRGGGMARAAAARGVEVLVPTAWQREVSEERGRLVHRVAASVS